VLQVQFPFDQPCLVALYFLYSPCAYSTRDGKVIWDFDTVREYETVNGINATGGAREAAGGG
jgi:hypothetical protein